MRIMMYPPDWQGVPDFTLEDGVVKARPGFNKVQIHSGFNLRANDWQYQDIMDMLVMGISVIETLGAGTCYQAEYYWHVQGWPIIVNAQLADNVIYLFDLDETGTPGKSDKSPRNLSIFYTRGNWKPESKFEVDFGTIKKPATDNTKNEIKSKNDTDKSIRSIRIEYSDGTSNMFELR